MNKENINIALKTLKLLKKKSWGEIRLEEIIKNSKKHKQSIKTKNDLLKNINRYVDYLLKKETSFIEKSSTKDMLFEVIMARFDVLQKYRNSFLTLFESFKSDCRYFSSSRKTIEPMPVIPGLSIIIIFL